jgi:hypothetical protein
MDDAYESSGDPDTAAVEQFQNVWETAVEAYHRQTKRDIAKLLKDRTVENADDFYNIVQEKKVGARSHTPPTLYKLQVFSRN